MAPQSASKGGPYVRGVLRLRGVRRPSAFGRDAPVRSRLIAALPKSHPGVSWPHRTHISDIRPCWKWRSESWPLRPHRNCRARSTNPRGGCAKAIVRFCAESVTIAEIPFHAGVVRLSYIASLSRVTALVRYKTNATPKSPIFRGSEGPNTRVSVRPPAECGNGRDLVGIVASTTDEGLRVHRSRNNALTTNARLAGRSPSLRMK